MTIASEANRSGPYACNGATTGFPYAFKIFDEAHVRVILTDAGGAETTLALGTDYVVTGVGADGGGAVQTAVAHPTGCLVTLILNVPFTQGTDLENQGAYFAETIERALDEGVQRDLQLAEEVGRAFKLRASADLVAAGSVFVSDGVGGATGGPSAADITAARDIAVASEGAAILAAATAGEKAGAALAAADRAETAAASVEGVVSYAVAQQLTAEEKTRALENLGLDRALTPFGFTAAEGQSAFALGMSPAPNACIVSQNGAWLTGGVDYAIAGSTLTLATAADAGDRISGVAISSFEVANAMRPAANLADLGDKAVARANLGLGSAAVLGAGTGAGEVLKLGETGKLPAVDGSQLTGVGLRLVGAFDLVGGAFKDIPGIPAGAKRITLCFYGLSTNGNSQEILRLGTSIGFETTGYFSGGAGVGGANSAGGYSDSTGLLFGGTGGASGILSGLVTLVNLSGNKWVSTCVGGREDVNYAFISGGRKELSGTLDRLRITTFSGTDVFDAGHVVVYSE